MNCVRNFSVLRRSVAVATCVVSLTGGLLPAVIWAGDEAAESGAEMSETAQAVADLGMAHDLIEYGRRTKTPEALITAALILHRIPAEQAKDQPEGPKPEAIDPAALLAEAKKLRDSDKALAEVADRALEAIQEQSRGSVTGPQPWGGLLQPGSTQKITRAFKARELALVTAQASPVPGPVPPPKPGVRPFPSLPPVFPPSLSVVVATSTGQVVGRQVGPSVKVQFVPPATGPCVISVTNVGRGPVMCRGFNN